MSTQFVNMRFFPESGFIHNRSPAPLIAGLQATGREVIDVGLVPTPLLYFAAQELHGDCGVMVTGSHNAKDYNGLKIVVQNESLSPEDIQDLRRRIDSGQLLQGAAWPHRRVPARPSLVPLLGP